MEEKPSGLSFFPRIMRKSQCLHAAFPNIVITSETRKACFISFAKKIAKILRRVLSASSCCIQAAIISL